MEMFLTRVVFDWLPPFCKKCQMVGRNCNVKNITHGPTKTTQKWVPNKCIQLVENSNQVGHVVATQESLQTLQNLL